MTGRARPTQRVRALPGVERRRRWLPAALVLGAALGRTLLAAAEAPPTPPQPLPPVALFRTLLATNAEGRDRLLSGRSARQRKVLEGKLTEYELMPAEERELRLQATELRYYLRPLLTAEPARRSNDLAFVPARLQPVVTLRLRDWDALPEETRQAMLAFDEAVQSGRPPAPGSGATDNAAAREAEDRLARWQGIAPDRRESLMTRFERFFEMPAQQQEQALEHLSAAERQAMEETLRTFAGLSPAQRRTCLNSFRKFADLSPRERSAFLRNADRWRELSAEERAKWRRLVASLPPLPPGLDPGIPLPPTPPAAPARRLATSANP